MIRLSKDKYLYNYTIDENGTIRDDAGVIQKTYIIQGRPFFKKIPIHRIMMYTFNGFKEGFDIHHIDKDKLNNKLSNLIYLNKSEHAKLHRKGKHLSEETKQKLSEINKGKHLSEETKQKLRKSLKGNHHTEETKKKISESLKGKNNGMFGKIPWNKGLRINK